MREGRKEKIECKQTWIGDVATMEGGGMCTTQGLLKFLTEEWGFIAFQQPTKSGHERELTMTKKQGCSHHKATHTILTAVVHRVRHQHLLRQPSQFDYDDEGKARPVQISFADQLLGMDNLTLQKSTTVIADVLSQHIITAGTYHF